MGRRSWIETASIAGFLFLLAAGATVAPGATIAATRTGAGQADRTVELDAAIEDLTSTDPVRQAVGARALAGIGKDATPAVDLLIGLLETGTVQVRSPLLGVTTPSLEARKALAAIGEPAVMPLAKALRNGGPRMREEASVVLMEIRSRRASDALSEALGDNVTNVRRNAAQALAAIADRKTVPNLVSVLRKDSDWVVREKAAQALGAIGTPPCFDPLVDALDDDSQPVRDAACLGLGKIGNARAIPPIVSHISDWRLFQAGVEAIRMIDSGKGVSALASVADGRDSVRATRAIWALGELENPGASPHLARALKREEPEIRMMAAKALRKTDGHTAVSDLIALLDDPNDGVRRTTASVLGEFGDSAAINPLLRTLTDRSPEVQEAAIRSLGNLGDRRVALDIGPFLQHWHPFIRRASASALGKIGNPESVPLLQDVARDNHPSVRSAVVLALGKIHDGRVLGILVPALADSEPTVRRDAAKALGDLKDLRAVEALIGLLDDPYVMVRGSAGQSLQMITGIRLGEDGVEWTRWWRKNRERLLKPADRGNPAPGDRGVGSGGDK